jgi:hypothetical protein
MVSVTLEAIVVPVLLKSTVTLVRVPGWVGFGEIACNDTVQLPPDPPDPLVVAFTVFDGDDTFPAASRAFTVNEYVVEADRPLTWRTWPADCP